MEVNGVTIDEAASKSAAAQYIAERNKPRPSNVTHTVSVVASDQPHEIDTTKAATNDDAVIDEPTAVEAKEPWKNPETGETKAKPTRGDKRRAKLWQERESERQMRTAAEQRVADLEAELAKRDAAPRSTSAAVETTDDDNKALTTAAQARIRPKPDRAAIGSTYQTYEDYVEDCAIWGGELAAEKRELIRESQQAETAAQRAGAVFQQERTAAQADYPDFEQVTNQDLQLTHAMADAVIHAPTGLKGHVQYWLGKHPDEMARIAALPSGPALVEMGIVIATVKAERAAKTKASTANDDADTTTKNKKPQSDAPPPPDRSTARSASTTPIDKIADPGAAGISPVDFIKARNVDERARRRL